MTATLQYWANMWEADTVVRRDKAMQELHVWLQQLPASMDKSLLTCSPADILVFMEQFWTKQHAGSTLADGSCIASPAGVNQCLSNLSTGFKLVGRVGDWSLTHLHGNPIMSTEVMQYI